MTQKENINNNKNNNKKKKKKKKKKKRLCLSGGIWGRLRGNPGRKPKKSGPFRWLVRHFCWPTRRRVVPHRGVAALAVASWHECEDSASCPPAMVLRYCSPVHHGGSWRTPASCPPQEPLRTGPGATDNAGKDIPARGVMVPSWLAGSLQSKPRRQ